MSAPRRVAVLAFDACDIDVAREFARQKKLPALDRLLREWSFAAIENPYGFFVGSTWTSFFTARCAAQLGYHSWDTITTSYERRLTSPTEVGGRPFWDALADAGFKVAVIDVPHSRARSEQSALEISEYGCHDRHFGLRASRAGLRDEIIHRFGFHPVFTTDPFAERHFAGDDWVHRAGYLLRTDEEEAALQSDLLLGLRRKQELSEWIYRAQSWDLFISVFGESHAVGHQSWYLHDSSHPRHKPHLARTLGDPLENVYEALDRALADHLEMFGNDTNVFVLLSHGMQAHYDATYALEPALKRIDAFDRSGLKGNFGSRLVKKSWLHLGDDLRAALAKPLTMTLRQYSRVRPPSAYFETDIGPEARARQRFYMSPNNSVYGGVRINLKGREAAGLVSPGRDFDAVCTQLTRDLLSLINLSTGDPVIRGVERTDAHYKRDPLDELPDLLIDWNHDQPVERIWSPKTGLIYAPYWHWRTGDHRPGGFLFARGPDLPAGNDLGRVENRDLGPTICAMLGVPLTNVDGLPVPALLGE